MPKARWLMIAMCLLANTINYVDRANLAVAAPIMQSELGFDSATMGFVLGGFFWTYAFMQMPFGWFADRVGARISLALAVVWWSIFTALTAVARGITTLLGCRLLLGVGEAGAYPSMAKVAANWFPKSERGLASSIFDSGSRIGAALSLPLVAWIISISNWETSFVVTGVLGIVWAVFWIFIYRDPEQHPSVTPEELARLQAERGTKPVSGSAVPWSSLFRYRTIWGMMIGFFCLNFVIYFFITWFPTYLVKARGFSLAQLGTLGLLPGLASIPCGWIGGFTSDALYRRGWSLTAARKTCLVGGMLIPPSSPFPCLRRTFMWRSCVSRSRMEVSPSRPPASGPCPGMSPISRSRRLDRRHPELRLQPRRHCHHHIYRRNADHHQRIVCRAARRCRSLLRPGCGGLSVHGRRDRAAAAAPRKSCRPGERCGVGEPSWPYRP